MANTKISQLPSATTPVVGTEVLPIVQSSTTSKVSIANLTAGRAVSASSYDATGATAPANGMFLTAANTLAFSTASAQVGKFLSASGGSFEVNDSTSTGYNGQRYIQVGNANTGTATYASVISTALNVNAKLSAFSPSHTTTALANKAVLWGYDAVGASSGTVVADFSTGANQIQFYLGTTASPLSVAHFLGAEGSLEVSDFAVNAGYNSQRYIVVSNVSTGTSAYAWTGAKALNVNAKLAAFSPSHTTTALANKSVLFGADGASVASGTAIADFSTGTNQIQFYVGTVASPTLAGTVSSTGNWNLYTATLTAGSFTPTSSSFQANSIYYPSTNTISVTNNSAVTASFTSANNFDVGTGNPTNASRSIIATNLSTGTSANASVSARSDVQYANLQAYSSTYPAAGGVTIAGKAILYAAGSAGSSGLTLWDNSNSQSMQFVMGSTVAATINSSAVLSLTNNPILTGGTINGVAYLNGSKALTTGSSLVFDGTNLGIGIAAPYTKGEIVGGKLQVSTAGGLGFAGGGAINAYTAAGAKLYFYDDSTVATIGSLKVGGTNALTFSAGGTTESMRLDFAGNLGLGVTPVASVYTSSRNFFVGQASNLIGRTTINFTSLNTNVYEAPTTSAATFINSSTAAAQYQQYLGAHVWRVSTNTPSANTAIAWNDAMTLDASGNLLVGTTSAAPNTISSTYVQTRIGTVGNLYSGFSSTFGFVLTANSYQYTGGTNRRIASGYTSRLDLRSDDGTITTATATTGAADSNITFTAGPYVANLGTSWTNASDERLKNITGEIQNGLAKVCTLRAAEYTWKDGENKKPQVGLIAQDLLKVLPEVVVVPATETDEEGNQKYLGVNYDQVIPLLVAAIKELKAEFDAYKAAHP